jgi:hypothetical protein
MQRARFSGRREPNEQFLIAPKHWGRRIDPAATMPHPAWNAGTATLAQTRQQQPRLLQPVRSAPSAITLSDHHNVDHQSADLEQE